MDGPGGVGVLAAFAAGTISFLSPCVLPLVPGYLSAVIGIRPDEIESASRRQVLGPSLLFIASFSAIFILLGLSATAIGSTLRDNRQTLDRVAAVVIVAMGVLFVAAAVFNRLNREWRVDGLLKRAGSGGPFVAGAAFAVAWTPCVGPTLAAILAAASLSESAGQGAILLGFYSAGLAVPFLASALAFNRMLSTFARVKRHFPLVIGAGGAILIAMGILIWTGELFRLNIEAQRLLERLGLDFFNI